MPLRVQMKALQLTAVAAFVGVAAASYDCVPLKQSGYCGDAMPKHVCAKAGAGPVDGSNFNLDLQTTQAAATCPKDVSLFTPRIFCQTNYIPCTEGLKCPDTPKLCYGLCVSGGLSGGHTFLGATECQDIAATTYCDQRVAAGEVAGPTDMNCVGLSYFNSYHTYLKMAKTPFQPRACRGRFPMFGLNMQQFSKDVQLEFMLALTNKINRLQGYTNFTEPYKFTRPINIRLRRVQMKGGEPQVFVEIREFCLIKLRKGKYFPWLRYNNDQYCDKVSVSPEAVYANLTAVLDSKKPSRGMMFGEFRVKKTSVHPPLWPSKCYTYYPDELPKIPNWVWALTALGAICCLLSLLILQHRFRNRASYVRHNEKLRSYS